MNPLLKKRFSLEWRREQSERMSGENNPMFGRRGEAAPMYGTVSPMKGVSPSSTTRKKLSIFQSKRFSDPRNHPMFGKCHSLESRKKMCEHHGDCSGENNSMFGRRHTAKWRRGHSGENHPMFGKHLSLVTKNKIAIAHEGMNHSLKTKKKISDRVKELWKDFEYANKMGSSWRLKPNNQELECFGVIDSAVSKKFKYVGNWKLWIDGKCPDFVSTDGSKLLIEFNSEYWHRGENTRTRARHFAKYGYRTLFIWDRELKNPERLRNRIIRFVNKLI